MKKFLTALTSLLVLATNGALVSAQHYHSVPHTTTHVDQVQHGNHVHNVPHTTTHYDSVPHYSPSYSVPHTTTHIDSVQHGNHFHNVPHTTTHYDSIYPSGISSSGVIYSTPNVIASPGIVLSNSIPSSSIAIPSTSTSIVSNKIPTTNGLSNAIPGRSFKLTNPRETQGSIGYTLNNNRYNINPGESQTVPLDREWILKFDNGLGKQVAYKLDVGTYEFSVSPDRGWDVGLRSEQSAPAPIASAPSLPSNSIPYSSVAPTIPQASAPSFPQSSVSVPTAP